MWWEKNRSWRTGSRQKEGRRRDGGELWGKWWWHVTHCPHWAMQGLGVPWVMDPGERRYLRADLFWWHSQTSILSFPIPHWGRCANLTSQSVSLHRKPSQPILKHCPQCWCSAMSLSQVPVAQLPRGGWRCLSPREISSQTLQLCLHPFPPAYFRPILLVLISHLTFPWMITLCNSQKGVCGKTQKDSLSRCPGLSYL